MSTEISNLTADLATWETGQLRESWQRIFRLVTEGSTFETVQRVTNLTHGNSKMSQIHSVVVSNSQPTVLGILIANLVLIQHESIMSRNPHDFRGFRSHFSGSRYTSWLLRHVEPTETVHFFPYPLGIKHGVLEHPLMKLRFLARKITYFYGPFSSTPSLMTPEGIYIAFLSNLIS